MLNNGGKFPLSTADDTRDMTSKEHKSYVSGLQSITVYLEMQQKSSNDCLRRSSATNTLPFSEKLSTYALCTNDPNVLHLTNLNPSDPTSSRFATGDQESGQSSTQSLKAKPSGNRGWSFPCTIVRPPQQNYCRSNPTFHWASIRKCGPDRLSLSEFCVHAFSQNIP